MADGSIETVLKLANGATVMLTGGNNIGRIGVLQSIEKHPGSYNIAHVKDSNGSSFATRASNVMVIGDSKAPLISLPRGNGIKVGLIEERNKRQAAAGDDEEEDDN